MTETTTTQELVRCTGCNRVLRSAKSIAKKIGRTCERNARRAAAVLGFKPAAIEKAKELIEQGGIIPLRARRVFQVVASNGIDTYKTAQHSCGCPAGLKSTKVDERVCYHRIAAIYLAA
jgi:hypothetical protein